MLNSACIPVKKEAFVIIINTVTYRNGTTVTCRIRYWISILSNLTVDVIEFTLIHIYTLMHTHIHTHTQLHSHAIILLIKKVHFNSGNIKISQSNLFLITIYFFHGTCSQSSCCTSSEDSLFTKCMHDIINKRNE